MRQSNLEIPDIKFIDQQQFDKEEYKVEVVTPIYGGGVKAGKVDTLLPVRASSIRGHLRAWWRVVALTSTNKQTLRQHEFDIWGGVGIDMPLASKIKIQVDNVNKCKPKSSSSYTQNPGIKYAYGPAATAQSEWLEEGLTFNLKVTYKKTVTAQQKKEVQDAIRFWAFFGGIGSRTRRGFGALKITSLDASDQFLSVTEQEMKNLGGQISFAPEAAGNNAITAWGVATSRFQKFRQGVGYGRNEGQGSAPGRSFWPEPDELRRQFKRNDNGRHEPVHTAGNVFPRAAFGMPLSIDFRKNSEPPISVLSPLAYPIQEVADRYPSPVLIKPLLVENQWRAAAILLPNWQAIYDLKIAIKDKSVAVIKHWPFKDSESVQLALARKIKPMCDERGEPYGKDPLSAFMKYFNTYKTDK